MALCVTVSGFALSKNEFVYTPQGRFQITGDNVASSTFADWTGWTVKGEGKTFDDKFNINASGYGPGVNSIISMDAVVYDATNEESKYEGIYFKFQPTSADAAYVVSFKMKGAALDNIRCWEVGDGYKKTANLVQVTGNLIDDPDSIADGIMANTAEELTEQWQTFTYAIVGDGQPRTWFIKFYCMNPTIEIADLQIAPAMQFADLRQRDAMVTKLEVYKNAYDWPVEVLADCGYDEIIANLKAIGDTSGQSALDEQLATAQEILDEFLKANMDDYLAGNEENYLGIKTTDGNTQKVSNYGDWTCTTTGRSFWNNGAYPDLGHYGGNNAWNWNDVDSPMGVYMQRTLDPGSYVFAIESWAHLREDATSSSWTPNEGWDPAFGEAYIVKIVEGVETPDTISKMVKDLQAMTSTQFFISAKIEESGTYEIGFKAYCKDAYKELKNGSAVYVANASLWGKNANKYNQKQLGYEENVRTQITAGRDALTKAAEYQADETYVWGKAALKAVAEQVEPLIAGYEAMDQDAIIATFEEDYVSSTTEETGYLEREVYQQATKLILDANRVFLAQNDTLNSIQTAIDNAEATLALRIYSVATGKADLQAAIDKAKATQTAMKAVDYSEENAAAIVAANEELAAAVEAFKASIPASAIATIADIDFENDATLNEETQLYSIAGAVGSMEFSHFSTTAPVGEDAPYEKGFWSNGEQKWKGYIRVGNGTGTVNFDATDNGSMGNSILKISCDFFIQGLNNRSVGFYLKDAEDNNISGVDHNYYQGSVTYNPFVETNEEINALMGKVWAKSGGSYNDASPAGVEEETANPLQKTNFEVIMDYGTNKMYCTITSINGTATSKEVEFTGIPTKYVLQCNYDDKFNTRRPWYDNLKIVRISTDATGISFVNADAKAQNGAVYNLAGQKVNKNFKGVVIKNGKKAIQK